MAKKQKNLKMLLRYLNEAGYSGQGHTNGAESFHGTYYGIGGDMQLAKKPVKAVRDLKKQRDADAAENFKDRQQRNRGYPAAAGFKGSDSGMGIGSGTRIPNTIAKIGKSPDELDALFARDSSKDYWGFNDELEEPEEDRDLEEQGTAGGGGPGRAVSSDSNYRDLQGFPRHNALEKEIDHIPPVEGDIDGDGEEDEYLEDEEYVNDVMRLNGLQFAPGSFKRLFGVSTLEESAKKTAVIIKGNPKYVENNPTAGSFYNELKSFLESEGYKVVMDSGEPNTTPPKADLWVGHSRGVDRLEYAPEDTATVALGVPEGVHHPDDNAISLKGKPPKDFEPNKYHFTLTNKMKKALSAEKLEEQGAWVSPSYSPEPDRSTERYKQGNTIEDHEPDATKKLIKHVDYTGGHTDVSPADYSPGGQAYGQVGQPKDFVPEDWEQRHWKTKEDEEAPMDMMRLEEIVRMAVSEALEERQVMSAKKLMKKLRKNKSPGCDHVRQKGSHATYKCDVCQTVVPVHGSQDIKPGTLKSIERDLEPCLGDDWLDEAIQKLVARELEEAFTGLKDVSGDGKPKGGSEAFEKNRKKILDYDKDQRPDGTDDLKNYHMGEK